MLQSEKPVIREYGGVWMSKNGENAALVGWFVVLHSGQANRETSGRRGRVKEGRRLMFFLRYLASKYLKAVPHDRRGPPPKERSLSV